MSSETIPLSGEWRQVEGFNANGIVALQGGRTLIIVNSTTGELYRVDAHTGVADLIETDGFDVVDGDGLALRGRRLYVVQNRQNKIVELRLRRDASTAELVETITSDTFDVPTTIVVAGRELLAVNARFGTPVEPSTPHTVTVVDG